MITLSAVGAFIMSSVIPSRARNEWRWTQDRKEESIREKERAILCKLGELDCAMKDMKTAKVGLDLTIRAGKQLAAVHDTAHSVAERVADSIVELGRRIRGH